MLEDNTAFVIKIAILKKKSANNCTVWEYGDANPILPRAPTRLELPLTGNATIKPTIMGALKVL